jgi:hypothetical protein
MDQLSMMGLYGRIIGEEKEKVDFSNFPEKGDLAV